MKGMLIAAGVIAALVVARVETMEASTKTVMVNTCNGPVALPLASCNGPVALPVASSCSGRTSLLAGVAQRMNARQEGRQAKRATKRAVKGACAVNACAVVEPPLMAVEPVAVTNYRPVTTLQPYTTIQYRAVPVAPSYQLKQPCNPGPSPPDHVDPNQDPPLSAPADSRSFTLPPKSFKS
jgi:ribosomal protein S28E/S33